MPEVSRLAEKDRLVDVHISMSDEVGYPEMSCSSSAIAVEQDVAFCFGIGLRKLADSFLAKRIIRATGRKLDIPYSQLPKALLRQLE
jgi:hypothetical protein